MTISNFILNKMKSDLPSSLYIASSSSVHVHVECLSKLGEDPMYF